MPSTNLFLTMNAFAVMPAGFAYNSKKINDLFGSLTYNEIHFRPYGNTNPLIWQLGHLNYIRNTITKLIQGDATLELIPSERELFGPKCQIQSPEVYPTAAELLASFTARGERIVALLKSVNPERFNEPSPFNIPGLGDTCGKQIYNFYLHENQHLGEINYIRTILVKNRESLFA